MVTLLRMFDIAVLNAQKYLLIKEGDLVSGTHQSSLAARGDGCIENYVQTLFQIKITGLYVTYKLYSKKMTLIGTKHQGVR